MTWALLFFSPPFFLSRCFGRVLLSLSIFALIGNVHDILPVEKVGGISDAATILCDKWGRGKTSGTGLIPMKL